MHMLYDSVIKKFIMSSKAWHGDAVVSFALSHLPSPDSILSSGYWVNVCAEFRMFSHVTVWVSSEVS